MENENMTTNYPRGGQPTEEDLKGWNWGAFFLNWIWALNHKYMLGLLALVPCVGFVMAIYMGIKGNQIAWESGRFATLEEMKKCQKVWMMWGLGIFAVGCILQVLNMTVLGAAAASGAMQNR